MKLPTKHRTRNPRGPRTARGWFHCNDGPWEGELLHLPMPGTTAVFFLAGPPVWFGRYVPESRKMPASRDGTLHKQPFPCRTPGTQHDPLLLFWEDHSHRICEELTTRLADGTETILSRRNRQRLTETLVTKIQQEK